MPVRKGLSNHILPQGQPEAAGKRSLTDAFVEALADAVYRGKAEPGQMLPSERELAEHHSLSRVTVRNALTRLVRDGVLDCVAGVGYLVSQAPPSPKLRRDCRPVGLIYHDIAALGARNLAVAAIESRLAESGRSLLLASSGGTSEGENAAIRRHKAAGAAGLIVMPAVRGTRSLELESWIRKRRPVVLEGHPGQWLLPDRLVTGCDRVDIDNRGGIRQAVEHLLNLGHGEFALLSSLRPGPSERVDAFLEIVKDSGLSVPTRHMLTELTNGWAGGREAFQHLSGSGTKPTAIVCTHNDIALGFMEAARAANSRCPRDFSISGFGNESEGGAAALSELTRVTSSYAAEAAEVLRLLTAQIGGARRRPEQVRVPMQLVVGKSSSEKY